MLSHVFFFNVDIQDAARPTLQRSLQPSAFYTVFWPSRRQGMSDSVSPFLSEDLGSE